MKRKFECYICGSKEGNEIFSIRNYPAYIVPLPMSIASTVVKADLPLYVCNSCGHMQVPEPDAEIQKLIYEHYYNFYVVDSSEALVPHYRTPFRNFITGLVESGNLKKGNTLEIGCSSGEQVEFLSGISKKYTGVDPNDKIKSAIEKFPQHTFIQGYFPDAIPHEQFDLIITQFNLEHIGNVRNFIQTIYDACNPGGTLIIQVPDCENFLRTHQPNFLAHEHIQYFTKNTLSMLLGSMGFANIQWGEEGPSLIAAAVRATPQQIDFSSAKENIEKANRQATLFNSFPSLPAQPVIFYGVGPQLFWLLSGYTGDIKKCEITDDNPSYQDYGLPGYENTIRPITAELIRKMKFIVLSLNKIYHQKVIQKIRSFNEPCSVLFLDDDSWSTINI